MAKGNMLQGMARGKVGDVVFSRLNGEQIARVRNRNPKNPKTNAQLFQRAIMATVMQAYSAGRVIFDHSFQGFTVGEANQRRFMSLNAKRLRGILATDLATDDVTKRSICAFNAPGVNSPAPSLIQISEGKYNQTAFGKMNVGMLDPIENETVAQYAARLGLVEGDLYTIVGFTYNENNSVFEVRTGQSANGLAPYKQYESSFFYARLKVKAGLSAINTVVTFATPLSTFFEVTDVYNCSVQSGATIQDEAQREWISNTINVDGGTIAVAGVIRSREGEDLRSTSYMQATITDEYYSPTEMAGISAQYLLQAWKQGTESIGDSDLILEGGDQ